MVSSLKVALCMFNKRGMTRRNTTGGIQFESVQQEDEEEEREREFVVKCEQSRENEDIAEYQSSPLQYCCNCTEEILTILAIPKILQVFPIYTILDKLLW